MIVVCCFCNYSAASPRRKKYAEIFEFFFISFLAVLWITYSSFRHVAMIVDKFLNLEVFLGCSCEETQKSNGVIHRLAEILALGSLSF